MIDGSLHESEFNWGGGHQGGFPLRIETECELAPGEGKKVKVAC